MAKDYFGSLNSRQIPAVKKYKDLLIAELSVDYKTHREILGKTKLGQGVHIDEKSGKKYTESGEIETLHKLDREIGRISVMSLPEFLKEYPRFLEKLMNEFPGDFVEERRTSVFPLALVLASLIIFVFTQSLQNAVAFGLLVLVARFVYAASHKSRPPVLVAVKA